MHRAVVLPVLTVSLELVLLVMAVNAGAEPRPGAAQHTVSARASHEATSAHRTTSVHKGAPPHKVSLSPPRAATALHTDRLRSQPTPQGRPVPARTSTARAVHHTLRYIVGGILVFVIGVVAVLLTRRQRRTAYHKQTPVC